MRVMVVGAGYVGLVTGVHFAELGHEVLCIEKDAKKLEQLAEGRAPIYEPGLQEALRSQRGRGKIAFTLSMPRACACEVALIAVGTPPLESGAADLSQVLVAVDDLAESLPNGAVIVVKSTVPVGTGDRIQARLSTLNRADLNVVSVPEFLRESTALSDTRKPNRLIFGAENDTAFEVLDRLHAGIDAPIVRCSRRSAELTKYASNAFLATKISFINEIANICDRIGADVTDVARGMGLDPRIGGQFLQAGLGYGGSCFPKDTRALVNIAGDIDYDFKMLRAVIEVNQHQAMTLIEKLTEWLGELTGKVIVLLGVSFKPHTDDTRESAAVRIAEKLIRLGADIRFCDPVVDTVDVLGEVRPVHRDVYREVVDADAAVLVTEWPQFLELDWTRMTRSMRCSNLIDGRNALPFDELTSLCDNYYSAGRPSVSLPQRYQSSVEV